MSLPTSLDTHRTPGTSVLNQLAATPEESIFSQLADAVDAAFYVLDKSSQHAVYASAGFQRLWNLDPAWITSVDAPWITLVHPEDLPTVATEAESFECRGVFDAEYRIVLPNNQVRWVHDRAAVASRSAEGTVERVAGVITEVTARRESENALARAQERLSVALRAAHAGAWSWDARTHAVEWTREQFALYGIERSAGAPTYEQWLALLHPEDRSAIQAMLRDTLDGRVESWHVSFRIHHPTLGERWLLGLGEVTRDSTGCALQLAGINIDITDRRQTELALEAAKQEAEAANASKSRFLAAASHDLRQPLQTINIIASLLARTTDPEAIRAHVQTLSDAARSMDDLLSALLDINRLETGAITPRHDAFPLNTVLAPLRSDLHLMAASKQLTISFDDCDALVLTDPALLAVILRNLIGNAIKYTERGSISVTCTPHDQFVEIAVRDTGIGMSPQHLDRIFEEFYQIDNPSRDRRRGVGLGLSIVQRVSALLQLQMSVQSTPGVGTVFTLHVPRAAAEARQRLADPDRPKLSPHRQGADAVRVLHIEDDAAIAKSMRMLLKLEGYDVTSATTAEAALQLVAEQGYRPDLIITDYQLPAGATGIDATRAIAARLGWKPPTILLTGDISERLKQDAVNVADCVLPKPVDVDQLLQAMNEMRAPLQAPPLHDGH
jgi:signal transduction histidine kinase/ActR/RegA family two-component response regulator